MVTGLNGIELITAERIRQIDEEEFDFSHDCIHTDGELALVAACYAAHGLDRAEFRGASSYIEVQRLFTGRREGEVEDAWPQSWNKKWDNREKKDRKTLLVHAGALIAAEIDRLTALEG